MGDESMPVTEECRRDGDAPADQHQRRAEIDAAM